MRVRRVVRLLGRSSIVSALLLAVGSALAVTGIVTDVDGKPVEEARVCHFMNGIEFYCALTDAAGSFEAPDSEQLPIRVVAAGYAFEQRPATGHHEIVLQAVPVLMARMMDAVTGEPIAKGELLVIYESGTSKGPFPVNAAGVRIERVLAPGKARLLGSAEGYLDNDPLPITLVDGEETRAVVKLEPVRDED